MGVRVDIRTNIYPVQRPDLSDSFWVGTTLDNGGFIQFGYQIEPGDFCYRGQVLSGVNTCVVGSSGLVGSADARWFWQYWPDAHGTDYYYGKEPSTLIGSNGEWHSYAIVPDSSRGWDFRLDGKTVDSMQADWAYFSSSPYLLAEKITYSNQPGNLGPVEFRNLQYLQEANKGAPQWKNNAVLSPMQGCGSHTQCLSESSYGASILDSNILIVGSGQTTPDLGPMSLLNGWRIISNLSQTFLAAFLLIGIWGLTLPVTRQKSIRILSRFARS